MPKEKDIKNMRNWCVGHIHKKDTQKPLCDTEFENLIKKIFPRGAKSYLLMLYDEDASKETLCSILDTLQKEIVNHTEV